jgi:Tol biopolymer transport system component
MWSKDGTILFSSAGGLFVVSSQGGARRQITEFAKKEFVHAWPQFLPDGKRFLFFAGNNDPSERGIYVASLSNPKQHTLILPSDGKAEYVRPSNGRKGYLLWQRERTLMAQPFAAGSLRLEGSASPLAEGVAFNVRARNSSAGFWTSDAGLLAYRVGELARTGTLIWFDRQGKRIGKLGSAEGYAELVLSPDGSRVVAWRGDDLGQNLWLMDIDRVVSARLTTDAANHSWPVWSPDGKQILYSSNRDDGSNRDGRYNLYRKSAGVSGQDELFFKDETNKVPSDWSRDGRFVLYTNRTTGLESIWVLPMAEGERKPREYLATQSMDRNGVFSPDGHWVAYESEISGRAEIYVSPFPDAASAPAVLVSKDGGSFPRWRRDGKELFYLSPDTKMMVVDVISTPSFKVSAPKTLFDLREFTYGSDVARTWDVSADGQRFLVNATEKQSVRPLTVVTNWHEKLKK